MAYPKDDKKLRAWEDGLAAAVAKNPGAWNAYDKTIQTTIGDYDKELSKVPGYATPDWHIVKAMLWTETGANSKDWDTAPMQIGVNGDPGLKELLTSSQGHMILPSAYQTTLTTSNVPKDGTKNIMAGVGYMLKILAKFGYVYDVPPPAPQVSSPPAGPGVPPPPPEPPVTSMVPTVANVGKAKTKEIHKKHPPHHTKPKQHLGITGWRPLTLEFLAKHYNVGDGNYAGKLKYALDLINQPPAPKPPVPGVSK